MEKFGRNHCKLSPVYLSQSDSKEINIHEHPNITLVNAPKMEISSSFIRKAISEGKDVRYFLPARVYDYISKMNFYKNPGSDYKSQ